MPWKTTLRARVKAALSADPRFAAFDEVSAWVQSVAQEDLPAYGVATPDELIAPLDVEQVQRQAELMVVLRRAGGSDLEDELDLDQEAAEAAVHGALEAFSEYAQHAPTRAENDITGETGQRVGSLTLRFAVERFTDRGAST